MRRSWDSREVLLDRYATYAEWFTAGQRVLDVCCADGAFLQLLTQRGAVAVGLDDDEVLVKAAREGGFDVSVGQREQFLAEHRDEFDGIFAAQLIEHLTASEYIGLVNLMVAALRPRGRLFMVGSNPGNLSVQLHRAWGDLDHVRFYTPEVVRWIARDAGLRKIDVGDNPRYREGPRVAQAVAAGANPPARRRLRSRLRQGLGAWLTPETVLSRLQAAEDAMRSLYPAAEFYVTGIR